MGYVIVGGIGLAVGLALMVWALVERGKRADAERAAQVAVTKAEAQALIATQNAAVVTETKAELTRVEAQLGVLQARLEELRERLVKCQDPEAIKSWLDSFSEGGPV